ncbi:ABC transporter permease [Halobaculum sp. CBA1158]|uniref:ABC transporter permease n=1 Tax=Halobaculum sp. CBA1158 TaxID=2904243 RepID=UPI001F40C2E3|nr:ABC transporter permease [Halobaculum sp. CBA1158]UIO99775.1 ABC transporter permease [Halobaculum sp. CBA1158]
MSLARYAARRTVFLIGTLFGASVITFALVNVLPGDVAVMILGTSGSPEQVETLRQQLGLNQPVYVRYIDWIVGVLQGDLGRSLRFGDPVATLIAQRFPASAFLAVSALTIAVLVAIPMGIVAAVEQNTWKDFLTSIAAFAGISLPNFFWGMVLILLIASYASLLPPSGYVSPFEDFQAAVAHVLLPAGALGFSLMAHITRMTRSSLIEELRSGYINLAKMKGLSSRRIVLRHALRNAFLPVLTVIGFQLGFLFGGIIIIEQLFAYPGLGRLAFNALLNRDAPLIQGSVLTIAVVFMTSNLVVDLLYAVIDPRVTAGGEA